MKNLKRALSLALASVMLLGMMVVGAGAADFGDADKIENTEAVNTLVALGILKGKDTGNFDPEGIVTRAEMAKMICVALNNGKDPNLVGGTKFPDTTTHWAGGYIDYCANMGIVSGDTAGNFNPDKTVTGTEAAKMILIALGFNSENEKFVNDAAWATNINVRASQKSLYEDVAINPSEGLTRDNAAQMIWNGLQADMVEYDYKVGAENGNVVSIAIAKDLNKNILSDRFGTYDDAPIGVMSGVTYNADKEKWTYTIDGQPSFTTDVDYTSLFGMNVKVIAKQSDKTVYGIFAEDSSVLAEGFAGDIKVPSANADAVEIDGTDYDLTKTAKDVKVVTNMTGTELGKLSNDSALAGTYSYKLIDNTDDGKGDILVVVPFTVTKVTYVGRDSLTITDIGSKDFEDINVYDGVAKNDRVVVTAAAYTADKTLTVEKAEIETATITGLKSGKYMVDGVWMTNNSGEGLAVNDTIEYIAYGSVLYYAKVTGGEAFSKDVALVISADTTGGAISTKEEAKLIFTDGSKKTVVTDEDYTSLVGKLVTYYINNDDEYVLKVVDDTNDAGYDGYDATAPAGSDAKIETIGGKDVADDAVIFVFKGTVGTAAATNDAKVITGKDAKGLAKATYANGTMALNSKSSGFTYTTLALITTTGDLPDTFDGSSYGYLTTDAYETREGGKTYRNFTLWNGSDEVKVKEQSGAGIALLTAGTVITYDSVDDATVKNVKVAKTTVGAVTGWDGDEKIQFHGVGASTKVTKDTTVLYVNSAKTQGVEGGSIELADEPTSGNFVSNVLYITGTDGLNLLVVDVNNKMDGVNLTAAKTADINAALAVLNTVVINSFDTDPVDVTVPAGKTLVVNAVPAQNSVITLKAGSTLELANGEVLGEGSDITSDGDIVITVEAAGVKYEATNVHFSADYSFSASNTFVLKGTLTGEAGVRLTIGGKAPTGAAVAGDKNFYSADKTKAAIATDSTYVWTLDCDSDTAGNQSGWMKQQ